MKGDFSRLTFDTRKHFSRVLKQQGRVDLDADFNELVEILTQLARRQSQDVIGRRGVPKEVAAFGSLQLVSSEDGLDLAFSSGHLYVDGIIVEVQADAPSYQTQPYYLSKPDLEPEDGRRDLVYLDVWERHITAIEDPDIREVALGGPDTTTRTQTIWQVKILPGVGEVTCADDIAGWPPSASDGTLNTAAQQVPEDDDPCTLLPQAGYRGLENRLYRVEIHTGSEDKDGNPTQPTFKWSKNNGAVVFAIEEFVDATHVKVKQLGKDQVLALHEDDWVEISDDAAELNGEPGTLARVTNVDASRRIISLSNPVSGYSVQRHAKVRCWDQGEDAIVVTTGTAFLLEHGIEVGFSGTTFHTGDYWVFAARTATATVEKLVDAPIQGVHHHHVPLALVTWQQKPDETWSLEVSDCRVSFPSLTDIGAEDVSFDNSRCSLVEASTVQEALDRLCAANDLRHHNKHLHGWGIVCGLQVVCGPDESGDERRHVTVRDGYAIDCEGDDLIIEQDRIVDILRAIEHLQEEDPDVPILNDQGDGEVCLTLELDRERQIGVGVERYAPEQDVLQGTLLMDFIEGCVLKPIEEIRKLLTLEPDDETALVGPAQKQFIALLNLVWQLFNPTYGRYIFLSQKEHEILHDLYEAVRNLLQSKTFCAMFEGARTFPDYPFGEHAISTIFGKGLHHRLRLHPRERLGYTVGADNKIHVYDLTKEVMIAGLEVPGGDGTVVRDVAFSHDGSQLYAIASLKDDTIFAVADISGEEFKWRPVTLICDIQLLTLATAPSSSEDVYAVGRGRRSGLFRLNPEDISLEPTPVYCFEPAGQLVVADELGIAYATVQATSQAEGVYGSVWGLELGVEQGNECLEQPTFDFPLAGLQDSAPFGQDDIAIARHGEQHWLFVVTDRPQHAPSKRLLGFEARPGQRGPILIDLEEDTAIRLAHVLDSPHLLISYEDSYRLRLVDVHEQVLLGDFHFPLQISPLALAADSVGDKVYALNFMSNTLSAVPANLLDPSRESDFEGATVPGSQAFLATLETYRSGIFGAFIDLLGGFLQYLKDCFCDHLLVNCPDCNEQDAIYLACVSVRQNQVHRVCNFSRRRYVKSFPTVTYWLSLVPILPLINRAVEQVCCAVLPSFFARLHPPAAGAFAAPVTGPQMRQGVNFVRGPRPLGALKAMTGQFQPARSITADWIGNLIARPQGPRTVAQGAVAGRRVGEVSRQLREADVEVVAVEAYDPAQGGENLRHLAQAPLVSAGARVKLYEENGVVRYFSPVEEEPRALREVREALDVQQKVLATLHETVAAEEVLTLKNSLTEVQTLLARRDEEGRALRDQLQALERKQQELEAEAPGTMKTLREELEELKKFRNEVQRFMKKQGQ
jgi:hypothetical protein